MSNIFPKPIERLPEANVPLDGVTAFLAQGENHQVIFFEFKKEVVLPEHFHDDQWEYVLSGEVDLCINGIMRTYKKGDSFFIPKDVRHGGKIYAGYTSIAFFNEKDRYKKK
jgi:quercetin dioxygenase-like cupin family protein